MKRQRIFAKISVIKSGGWQYRPATNRPGVVDATLGWPGATNLVDGTQVEGLIAGIPMIAITGDANRGTW